jgi:hypothetical protein
MGASGSLGGSIGVSNLTLPLYRHPELVSGPIYPHAPKRCDGTKPRRCASVAGSELEARWVLKQVQDDVVVWLQASVR